MEPIKEEPLSSGITGRQVVNVDSVEMPQSIHMIRFAQSRAREMEAVMKMVEKKAPKKACQQVPRHMRRRASSYNPKRVPKRLRERACREIEANRVKPPKRPSRKFRRRPKNLLNEYNRRKRKHKWLETHIWFAKRFKMREIWGYKLPLHSNEKSYRASYRSSFRHCLVNDVSYYGCLELEGPEDMILAGLSSLTSPDTGLTFKAKAFLSGQSEGQTILYHQHSYPFRVIGPAQFLWKPVVDSTNGMDSGNVRHMWIWVHPLMYDELVEELHHVFGFVMATHTVISEDDDNGHDEPSPAKEPMDQEVSDSEAGAQETLFLGRDGVTMYLLRDSLVRLRLTGALAQMILATALQPIETIAHPLQTSSPEPLWWEEYVLSENFGELMSVQSALWQQLQLQSSDFLPPGTVIGLTVLDPRLRLPKRKLGVTYDSAHATEKSSPCLMSDMPPNIAFSPIWSTNVRKAVSQTMMSQSEINAHRSQFLVPGSKVELDVKESRIPLLVIKQGCNQDSGNPCYGYGSSWDLIAPSGWAVAFLIAFVYRGARAGGLRELETISREGVIPIYPQHYPDSVGGQKSEINQWQDRLRDYMKHPPAKRPSFEKLRVYSPFYPQWIQLLHDWKETAAVVGCEQNEGGPTTVMSEFAEVSVTRNRKALKHLQAAFQMTLNGAKHKVARYSASQKSVCDSIHILERLQCALEATKYFTMSQLKLSLVMVQVLPLGKGVPIPFSMICVPLQDDLRNLYEDPSFTGPEEPIIKVVGQDKPDKGNNSSKKKSRRKLKDQTSFSTPPQVSSVRNSCSREVLGFIETGDYSFFQSLGSGIGFCSLIGLMFLLKACAETDRPPLVLFRNQESRKYYFAKIRPLMPF